MKNVIQSWMRVSIVLIGLTVVSAHAQTTGQLGSREGSAPSLDDAAIASLKKSLDALVKVDVKAVSNARSSTTLGPERSGNGVLIEKNLVLTIGYLILEAEEVEVTDFRGKRLPGVVAGYDHATGFGLVRLPVPSTAEPLALGSSSALGFREMVLAAGHGGAEAMQPAYVLGQRLFTGGWEYMLDEAIFTFPPLQNWGGAALINKQGELVGIGSLFLRDAGGDGGGLPGNMFVPTDLLKPILAELKRDGKVATQARPWLGVNTEEVNDELIVTRVSPEGPADKAGLRRGDQLVAVGTTAVKNLRDFYRALWKLGAAGVSVPLTFERSGRRLQVKIESADRMNYMKPRQTL